MFLFNSYTGIEIIILISSMIFYFFSEYIVSKFTTSSYFNVFKINKNFPYFYFSVFLSVSTALLTDQGSKYVFKKFGFINDSKIVEDLFSDDKDFELKGEKQELINQNCEDDIDDERIITNNCILLNN